MRWSGFLLCLLSKVWHEELLCNRRSEGSSGLQLRLENVNPAQLDTLLRLACGQDATIPADLPEFLQLAMLAQRFVMLVGGCDGAGFLSSRVCVIAIAG